MKYLLALFLISSPAQASVMCTTASSLSEAIACVKELSKAQDKLKDRVQFLETDNDILQKQLDKLRADYKAGK